MIATTEPKFRLGICGGGVGGLSLALTLAKYPDISVTIYEAAKNFTEVGAGVGLWPRALKVLDKLGLRQDVVDLVGGLDPDKPAHIFHYRKSNEPRGLSFYDLVSPGGLLRLHRADFQKVLLSHLPPSHSTHTSKRLASYTQPSSPCQPITLTFADGTTATCDLLVGADGLRSSTRAGILRELVRSGRVESEELAAPIWSGEVAYRALIPMEEIRASHPQHRCITTPSQFLGRDNYVLTYPIQHGTHLNFVAFQRRPELEGTTFPGPWMAEVEPGSSEWKEPYRGWDEEVQQLLEVAPAPLRWAIHTAPPLPTWVSGRVTILGDAAHAMAPHEGSGAGQAIEDAYMLGTLLGHALTTLDTLPAALGVYDRVRRPFAELVQRKSRENGMLFTFQRHDVCDNSPATLADLAYSVRTNWEWAWITNVDGDVERAVRMLESEVGGR